MNRITAGTVWLLAAVLCSSIAVGAAITNGPAIAFVMALATVFCAGEGAASAFSAWLDRRYFVKEEAPSA